MGSLGAAIKVLLIILEKVVELHEAGVDEVIIDDIHKVLNDTKAVVEKHHDKEVKKKGKRKWNKLLSFRKSSSS